MAQQEHLQVDLRRTPTEGVPVHDEQDTRAWMVAHVETLLLHAGQMPSRLLYVGEDWMESVELKSLMEAGREETIARMFVALGQQRPGVLRRYRVGEALVRDEAGRMRRALGVLEHVPSGPGSAEGAGNEGAVEGGWWLAHRFAGQDATGRGILRGDAWTFDAGDNVQDLPDGFREWLDVGRAELESIAQTEKPQRRNGPDIRTAFAELRAPLPEEPQRIAGAIGSIIKDELLERGLQCHLLFAASSTTMERWEVRGELPCSIDDLLRSVGQRDASLVALGHVGLATVHLNGEARRAFYCEVERGGSRGRWFLPVVQAGDPLPAGHPGIETAMGPVPKGEKPWLGAEPGVTINFEVLGMEGLAHGIAEG